MFKKFVRIIVAITFLLNETAFALGPGVVSGQLRPNGSDTRDDMYAAGQKLFAARRGPGSINWESYINRDGFQGDIPNIPGLKFVQSGDMNVAPAGWENNKLLNAGVSDLIQALTYFRDSEAKLPASYDIREGYYEVDKAGGGLPISRWEYDAQKDSWTLVVHYDFVQMWNNILANDVRFEYTFPDGEKRTVSLAWAVFYRIAKHEMADLQKKTGTPKGGGHITENEATDGEIGGELAANTIGGRYNIINDAVWMWFLGSYAFGSPTQRNNDILKERLTWFFAGKEARDMKLNLEFPNLLRDDAARKAAIGLALALNRQFYAHYRKTPDEEYKSARMERLKHDYEMRKSAVTEALSATGKEEIITKHLPGRALTINGKKYYGSADHYFDTIYGTLQEAVMWMLSNKDIACLKPSVDKGMFGDTVTVMVRNPDNENETLRLKVEIKRHSPEIIHSFSIINGMEISTGINSKGNDAAFIGKMQELLSDIKTGKMRDVWPLSRWARVKGGQRPISEAPAASGEMRGDGTGFDTSKEELRKDLGFDKPAAGAEAAVRSATVHGITPAQVVTVTGVPETGAKQALRNALQQIRNNSRLDAAERGRLVYDAIERRSNIPIEEAVAIRRDLGITMEDLTMALFAQQLEVGFIRDTLERETPKEMRLGTSEKDIALKAVLNRERTRRLDKKQEPWKNGVLAAKTPEEIVKILQDMRDAKDWLPSLSLQQAVCRRVKELHPSEDLDPYFDKIAGELVEGYDGLRGVFYDLEHPKAVRGLHLLNQRGDVSGEFCTLCYPTVVKDLKTERGLPWGDYNIFFTYFPFAKHGITIGYKDHVSQKADRAKILDMLRLIEEMPSFRIVFNGVGAGAAIPKHTHFQGFTETMPVEELLNRLDGEERLRWGDTGKGSFVTLLPGYPASAVVVKSKDRKTLAGQAANIVEMINVIGNMESKNYSASLMFRYVPGEKAYYAFIFPRNVAGETPTGFDGMFGISEISGKVICEHDKNFNNASAQIVWAALKEAGIPQDQFIPMLARAREYLDSKYGNGSVSIGTGKAGFSSAGDSGSPVSAAGKGSVVLKSMDAETMRGMLSCLIEAEQGGTPDVSGEQRGDGTGFDTSKEELRKDLGFDKQAEARIAADKEAQQAEDLANINIIADSDSLGFINAVEVLLRNGKSSLDQYQEDMLKRAFVVQDLEALRPALQRIIVAIKDRKKVLQDAAKDKEALYEAPDGKLLKQSSMITAGAIAQSAAPREMIEAGRQPAADLAPKRIVVAPNIADIISDYAARIARDKGPGVVEPAPREIAAFYPLFGLLETQPVEIWLPQSVEKQLTAPVRAEIAKLNKRIRERSGSKEDAITIKPYDGANLSKKLAQKSDKVRRIFINDLSMTQYFRDVLRSADGVELFKGNRIFTTTIPQGRDELENSVFQAWLVKVSILSCLLTESNAPVVGAALRSELEGRFEGDPAEFIDNLAKDETSATPEAVARRVNYFLGKIVKLSKVIAEQLRMLKAFWTAA